MPKKILVPYAIFSAIPVAVASMIIFAFLPSPWNEMTWVLYVGIATTFLCQGSFKTLKNVWSSYGMGVLWALCFWYFMIPMMVLFKGNGALAILIDVFAITVVLMVIHIGFLSQTIITIMALAFPPVFLIFESGGDMKRFFMYIVIMFTGSFVAMAMDPFAKIFIPKLRGAGNQ